MSKFNKYLDNINVDTDIDNEFRTIISKAEKIKNAEKLSHVWLAL